MSQPLLAVAAAAKRFKSTVAVDDLSFAIEKGEIFALLGPNGAGKTTTVRMLNGILRPDAGTITYHFGDGPTTTSPSPRRLGYLPEDRGLYPGIPVLRTLTFMGVVRGMPAPEARAAGERWLERMSLLDRKNDNLEELSKGNQQKVQIIASVLHRPSFAMLDEPFTGLDPLNQELALELIAELRRDGTTVLLSAHQMALVERLADRVLLMSRGREIASGTVDEAKASSGSSRQLLLDLAGEPDLDALRRHPAVASAELTGARGVALHLSSGGALGDLLRAVAADQEILGLRTEEVTLHQAYLDLVGAAEPRGPTPT